MIYVSMTGFRPNGFIRLPAFWWRTIKAFSRARRVPGNLLTIGRIVDGVYHTMTVLSDLSSMRHFVSSGGHLKAMKNFRALGTGRIFGYACEDVPDWDVVYQLWRQHGREVQFATIVRSLAPAAHRKSDRHPHGGGAARSAIV